MHGLLHLPASSGVAGVRTSCSQAIAFSGPWNRLAQMRNNVQCPPDAFASRRLNLEHSVITYQIVFGTRSAVRPTG